MRFAFIGVALALAILAAGALRSPRLLPVSKDPAAMSLVRRVAASPEPSRAAAGFQAEESETPTGAQGGDAPAEEPSMEAAERLARKIAAIQHAEGAPDRRPGADSIEVSDVEMESFVLYWMKDEIPARVDAIDVILTPDSVAAATELTFDQSSGFSNPVLDLLLRGTHTLFVKGELTAASGVGKFQLQEVQVDGLPVPLFIVESIVDRYVKPDYPDVDLDAPFQIPWGIEQIDFNPSYVTVAY